MQQAVKFVLAFSCCFVASVSSWAASNDSDAIVVTATRTRLGPLTTLTPSILIDRTALEASQAADVADLLRFNAGLDMARNGGFGQPASLFIRGAESNHTLVLVDGVKINPATIGGAALQHLNPDIIDRIEVAKGPRSTLYGSEAIGGVVQIFTRRGVAGTDWSVTAGGGADQTREFSGAFHHAVARHRIGLNLSHLSSDGFPARVGGTEDSGHDNTSVSGYVGISAGATDVELSHWQSQGNTEYYGFSLEPLDQDFTNSVTALTLRRPLGAQGVSTVKLSNTRDEIEQNQNVDFAYTRRTVFDWQHDHAPHPNHLLTAGVLISRENAEAQSFGTGFDEDTDVNAVFLQDQYERAAHRLQGALRYLDHSSFGSRLTGDIAYGYRWSPRVLLTASANSGFRAPDATDRFGFGGNPDLNPEKSRHVELGLRFKPSAQTWVSVSAFETRLDDLINFADPDGFLGPVPGRNENIDEARVRGLELSGQLTRGPWNVRLDGIIQDPVNLATGAQLARRAKRSLSINASYAHPLMTLGINALASSERTDSDFSATVNPGYGVVNLYAERHMGANWALRGRLENAFDKDYTLADGFNTQDRALFVEIKYTPGKAVRG